jgi:hypothetical protein
MLTSAESFGRRREILIKIKNEEATEWFQIDFEDAFSYINLNE